MPSSEVPIEACNSSTITVSEAFADEPQGVQTICNHKWVHVTLDDLRDVVWIGVTHCPSLEDIDNMWVIVSTFVRNFQRELAIHIEHVLTDDLQPLPRATMVHILSVLSAEKLRVKCILFQPRRIDNNVIAATNMFRFLSPGLELAVCDGGERAQKVLSKWQKQKKSAPPSELKG